ncbi:MAG: hypothetical protein JWR55_1246 [Aeromicrobium sp.]|jgi:hypothetical protein|nr:hypothetical protein [Aeromicrobium sp.]
MSLHSTPSSQPWSVLVYRVTDLDVQQRILMAFREIDRPGVVALGTYADDGPHLVVESPSRSGESYSRRVIHRIDPRAVCLSAGSGQNVLLLPDSW